MRISEETTELTRLAFEEGHARNNVHIVGKQEGKGAAITSAVITTVAKCLVGGGGSASEGNAAAYPAQLSWRNWR